MLLMTFVTPLTSLSTLPTISFPAELLVMPLKVSPAYRGIIINNIDSRPMTIHLSLFYINRNGKIKCRAAIRIILYIQSSAMRLNNRTADRKPHTQTIRFTGKKMSEKLRHILRRNPASSVLYCHHNCISIFTRCANQNFTRRDYLT